MSRRDTAILNCVYVRKSDTHLDRDVGQRPPTLTEVISTPRQSEAHPRDASFFKDRSFALFFLTRYQSLVPFVKTIPQLSLRVSLLRKNMRQEDSPVSLPSSGPSFVFCLSPSNVLSMHFRISHDATVLWIFIRLFIWFELPESRLLVQHDKFFQIFVRISSFSLFAVIISFAKIYRVAILENNS